MVVVALLAALKRWTDGAASMSRRTLESWKGGFNELKKDNYAKEKGGTMERPPNIKLVVLLAEVDTLRVLFVGRDLAFRGTLTAWDAKRFGEVGAKFQTQYVMNEKRMFAILSLCLLRARSREVLRDLAVSHLQQPRSKRANRGCYNPKSWEADSTGSNRGSRWDKGWQKIIGLTRTS
ncbi:hypothetical protein OIDMADRAFT_51448 [Oidiodendron maius Zn]|uniref:Uncharacterized protein n=1 Tax=Oidiodendron maius (strain Zn) TaxID=913774 RepID=A0A0C3HMB6_OIDMZ|nr:hypothetical protein OIDMADRAFT_51448 [Oidiodendron maius Zn]